MTSCPRPHLLAPRRCVLTSVLRCCSRSWRSWPVSATRLMGASWRSWPRWIATSCGVPRGRGRWRRWWPGRRAVHRPTPTRSPPWRAGCEEFPRCAQGMREGRLSLDQVGVIAARAGEGSDEHYAELARGRHGQPAAHRGQAGTPTDPEPDSRPEPQPSITKTTDEQFTCWRIRLPHLDAAKFDAALQSHRDALIAEWKHDHDNRDRASDQRAPVAGHRRGVHAPGRGRLGRRGRPPAARAAHHRGDALDVETARRGAASGSAALRGRTPIPDL